MNAELKDKIQVLRNRVRDFAEKFKENQEKTQRLEKENANLKAELEAQQEKVAQLEQNLKVAKLSGQMSGSASDAEENKVLRKKLNEYIKEIDKCVALLNN